MAYVTIGKGLLESQRGHTRHIENHCPSDSIESDDKPIVLTFGFKKRVLCGLWCFLVLFQSIFKNRFNHMLWTRQHVTDTKGCICENIAALCHKSRH